MRTLALICLWAGFCFGQSSQPPITVQGINRMVYVDGVKYKYTNAGVTSAIASLGSGGGVVQLSPNPSGCYTFTTTVTISVPVSIQFNNACVNGPSSGYVFDIEAVGTSITGAGNNFGTPSGSYIVSNSNTHGIYIGKGIIFWHISDLQVKDGVGGGRTAGSGIFADANPSPAQNQIGYVTRFVCDGMYQCVNLQRPINSHLSDISVLDNKQDGIVLVGDGTTVVIDNPQCFAPVGRCIHASWMSGVIINGGESSQAGGDAGILVDSISTNPSSDVFVNGMDFESNVIGFMSDDAAAITLSGNFNDQSSDAIRFKGGAGFFVNGLIRNSGGYGINFGVTSTLSNASGYATLQTTQLWTGNSSGDVNDPNLILTTLQEAGTANIKARGFNSLQVPVANLPAAASGNAGWIRAVSDSTTISAEGQTCVGGNATPPNTAIAISNGSVWKCF